MTAETFRSLCHSEEQCDEGSVLFWRQIAARKSRGDLWSPAGAECQRTPKPSKQVFLKRLPVRGRVALRCRWQMKQGVSECRGLCATQAFAPRRTQGTANGCCQRKLTEGFYTPTFKKLATQDVLTYCTTRSLPYHLYADGSELFVFGASLPSGGQRPPLQD